MEKGTIKIKKNGVAFINKKIAVTKLFDLSNFIPESGSVTFDCEYEVDDKTLASKIMIDGNEIGVNDELIKIKENRELRKALIKKREELRDKESKKHESLKRLKIDNFVDISKTFIPKDTAEIISEQEYIIDNFNLELNKLPRLEDDKFQFFKTNRGKIVFEPKVTFDFQLINHITFNEVSIAKSLFKNDDSFKTINFKPNWRIIVGLGGESVYETSITLHYIYGVPYIPASSIKGVVRSWIITEAFGNSDTKDFPTEERNYPLVNAEFRAYQDENFCYTFGCPKTFKKVIFKNEKPLKNSKGEYIKHDEDTKLASLWSRNRKKFSGHIGKITFFDAFPTTEPKIEVDIMNPHYPDYYAGNKAPTDTQNPVPIPFLTVAKTDFQFIVGTRDASINEFRIQKNTIVDWLKEALSLHGIGAKTAVGYGIMNSV